MTKKEAMLALVRAFAAGNTEFAELEEMARAVLAMPDDPIFPNPKYEIIQFVTPHRNGDFALLETIETWNGPRTYIRRGFKNMDAIYDALAAKGRTI